MSVLKEKAHKIIDQLPDNKMAKVINILINIKEILENSEEIDAYDMQLIEEAEQERKKGEYVSFEEVLKEAGLSEKDLQY
ncbi:hypothetical protein ACETAC_03905 [Aceticella autotrophica]|uniref:Uncharacterized protein n=1 Tax=Aceticella autotrophica TaxID=2755338 RepID=A0A975AWY6_9THEO|nr:hypothetical protein [Aceticella autotrophica]QSZ28012.1 hypothetical protein ACETAC_03905 [Aceticella autotrophica]